MTVTTTGEEIAARKLTCPHCGAKPGEACLGLAIAHIERRYAATAAAPPAPANETSDRAEFYVTFGVQYAMDPHPAGTWVHPDGYLVVEYGTAESTALDANGKEMASPRERARQALWTWLGGRYAFDRDEVPAPLWYPRGEIARLVLP